MSKANLLIVATATLGLSIIPNAQAQQTPGPTPRSTAQLEPSACGAVADKAADNVFLRINGDGSTTRYGARVFVYKAQQAAVAGDEKECWKQLNTASIYGVRW